MEFGGNLKQKTSIFINRGFCCPTKGFDMEVVIGKEYGFDSNKRSSITITLEGSTETDECDVIAFTDADVDKYFGAAIRLDSRKQ